MTAPARVNPGELLVSLALLALGSFVVYGTGDIAETQGYSQVGPRLFPYLIGIGMTLCGAVLGWQALNGGWRHVPLDDAHTRPDRMSFVILSLGLVLHMLLIGWAGFILASTLMFVLIARGFGSQRPLRDLLIGAALTTAAFLVFTHGLGLKLPGGPFGD
jgi:putative tricarboxylic transport membrane protein